MKVKLNTANDGYTEVIAVVGGPDGELIESKTIVNVPLDEDQENAFNEAINNVMLLANLALDDVGFSAEERAINAFISVAVDTEDEVTVEDLEAKIPEAIERARQPIGAPVSASSPATQLEPDEAVSVAGSE